MAKSTYRVQIFLELDRDEANYLRALLQNPDGCDEDLFNRKHREAIFAAIPSEKDTYIS